MENLSLDMSIGNLRGGGKGVFGMETEAAGKKSLRS